MKYLYAYDGDAVASLPCEDLISDLWEDRSTPEHDGVRILVWDECDVVTLDRQHGRRWAVVIVLRNDVFAETWTDDEVLSKLATFPDDQALDRDTL